MSGLYLQLSLARRQMLLLETLKVKQAILDPIPPALKLPIAVSCYWVQHSEVKAKLQHLQALLLGMLLGPLHTTINSPGRYMGVPGICSYMLLAYNPKFKQQQKNSQIIYSHHLYQKLEVWAPRHHSLLSKSL